MNTKTEQDDIEDCEEYMEKYDIIKVLSVSPIYNCHSYAWYD